MDDAQDRTEHALCPLHALVDGEIGTPTWRIIQATAARPGKIERIRDWCNPDSNVALVAFVRLDGERSAGSATLCFENISPAPFDTARS